MSDGTGQVGVRLDTMLARDTTLQWAEAVAIVQAVCRQLVATGASGFPATSQIVLYGDGAVVALATTQQLPVAAAAHLLASVLAEDAPVRLRLLVSQATGADGAYASLQEFCEALAYFERPDPANLLSDWFRRVDAAPARAAGTVEPSPLPVVPAQAPAETPVRASVGKGTRRPIVAAAAVILACLAAWLIGNRSGWMTAPGDTKETVGEPPAATPPAAAKGSRERGRAPARTSSAVIQEAVSASASVPGSSRPVSELAASSRPEQNADLAVLTSPIERPWPSVGALPPVAYVYRDVLSDSSGLVYAKGDPDVIPPQSVYPKLPTDPPGPDARGRTVLELLISADGSVERARLRTPPRDVHEFMLVSAAKTWRFDPATVHGRPVRFLYNVPITSLD